MTTPAPVGVPTFFESLEAKEALLQQSVTTHLASMKASTLATLKAIATEGAAIPAELTSIAAGLTAILPELNTFGSDFFTLLSLITQVTQIKAVPVNPPSA